MEKILHRQKSVNVNIISKRVVLIKLFETLVNMIGYGIGTHHQNKIHCGHSNSLTCRSKRTFVSVITVAQSKVKQDYELDLLNPNIQ